MMISWIALTALTVSTAAPRSFAIDPKESRIQYFIDHKLHDIRGASAAAAGKLVLQPDGRVLLMVRVAVSGFKSGDTNRDVHLQEVVEAAKYPYVIFKAVAPLPEMPKAPTPKKVSLKGQLDFHGRKEMETIPLTISQPTPNTIWVTGAFVVSLDRYGVERPSLFFVQLRDECQIRLKLKLVEESR